MLEVRVDVADSTGQAWRSWWLIVVGALVIIMVVGVFFVVKKGKDGDSGQYQCIFYGILPSIVIRDSRPRGKDRYKQNKTS